MIFIKYETCFFANEKDIIAAIQVLYGTYYFYPFRKSIGGGCFVWVDDLRLWISEIKQVYNNNVLQATDDILITDFA